MRSGISLKCKFTREQYKNIITLYKYDGELNAYITDEQNKYNLPNRYEILAIISILIN